MKVAQKIVNTSDITPEQIKTLVRLGGFMNYWRERKVDVYVHPTEPDQKVITTGYNAKSDTLFICTEPRSDWAGRIANNNWRDYR